MEIVNRFVNDASKIDNLTEVIKLYKDFAKDQSDGYLNTYVFQRMRDGKDNEAIKRFFAGPFAEVRVWLPEMFGLYISRFPDYPYTYVVVDNLSDEYGKYLGHNNIKPSHAQLYRRLLDELGVKVLEETMTTPKKKLSKAASNFYNWFKKIVINEPPEYLIGHFLAYEITDVLDFPDYLNFIVRIWPDRKDLHEFFTQHAESGHDAAFSKDLQPLFLNNKQKIIKAMGNLLECWTIFYQEASEEIK